LIEAIRASATCGQRLWHGGSYHDDTGEAVELLPLEGDIEGLVDGVHGESWVALKSDTGVAQPVSPGVDDKQVAATLTGDRDEQMWRSGSAASALTLRFAGSSGSGNIACGSGARAGKSVRVTAVTALVVRSTTDRLGSPVLQTSRAWSSGPAAADPGAFPTATVPWTAPSRMVVTESSPG
jgi:hypothetical protein